MKVFIQKALALALTFSIAAGAVPQAIALDEQKLDTVEIVIPDNDSAEQPTEEPADESQSTGSSVSSVSKISTKTSTSKVTTSSKATTTTKRVTTRKTAATTAKKVTTKRTTTTTKAAAVKKTVKLTQNIVLYKGERKKLDIVGANKDKVTVKTANKKIVAVSGTKLTAKKSGSTKVTVTVKSGKNTYIVTVNITVKVSAYDSSVSYSATKSSSALKEPALVWHKAVKAGNSFSLKMSGYDSVSFSSSKPSVASVTKKGVVTAKSKGVALIKAKVKAGDQSYTFYTKVHVYKNKAEPTVSQEKIDSFFGESGFIGSSIGVGQQMYFDSMGYNFLGHPTMMVRGCYAFHNDEGANGSRYQISYGDYVGAARYVVQHSGVKRVFINMGTNDMISAPETVFNRYVSYIEGIRAVNPKVPIYIEAMTPVYAGGEKGYLCNLCVNTLNSLLADYCKNKKDIYFIDINTPLKVGTGSLPAAYTSDNYVHLTNAAYAVWTDTVVDYVKAQLIAEQRAKDAVKTYTECKSSANLKAAKKLVKKLHASTLKTNLSAKLK